MKTPERGGAPDRLSKQIGIKSRAPHRCHLLWTAGRRGGIDGAHRQTNHQDCLQDAARARITRLLES